MKLNHKKLLPGYLPTFNMTSFEEIKPMFRDFNIKPLVAAMIAASILSACGGGGGGGGSENPPANQPSTGNTGGTGGDGSTGGGDGGTGGGDGGTGGDGGGTPTVDPQRTTMNCAEGAGFQCSGETVLLTEGGVSLTNSGVQVVARSTSDELAVNPSSTTPTGMRLFDQGKADIRLGKNDGGQASAITMLLSDLGIRWGKDEEAQRPLIIETFSRQQGRVQLVNGVAQLGALPPSSDTAFYDFLTLGANGTQANYANNVYFPKDASTVCSAETLTPGCETTGLRSRPGPWRTEGDGNQPDNFAASRLHNDGDIHAGDGVEGATGNGLPETGSKGYRSVDGWNYTYANLSTWISQDTVKMVEWAQGPGTDEHNTLRRGVVTFGDVTDPAAVPTTGSASYSGIVYGYYGTGGTVDPEPVYGNATATVDFATRIVTVTFSGVQIFNASETPVPSLNFSTAATGGTEKFANYSTGPATSGNFTGQLSARYFGPVSAGGSGTAPAELGGALRLGNAAGGAFIGGFIARKD